MRGKNTYACATCGHVLITIDVDEGTTPAMLACRNSPCKGKMWSSFYEIPLELVDIEPTHEWHKPSLKWARRQGPWTLDHVQRGGLVLRERT